MAPLPLPRQLPPDTVHFTGRSGELDRLDTLFEAEQGLPKAVVITAIDGTAGVGKTALAVHWALQVRDRFADGDLYVNLCGYHPTSPPVHPGDVLDEFLRALNVPPDRIPIGLDARAALYRSLLTDRSVLVLLDNAASAEQVRPLLPSTSTCLVLLTSRSRLAGLAVREGVHRVTLDLMPPGEAIALLRHVIGDARVDAEPMAATTLARECAYLPLALRITADRAAARPDAPLSLLARELADERERLDSLSMDDDGENAVSAVFSWSYRSLPPKPARMFRLLGLHAGPEVSVPAAAAQADTTVTQAGRLLHTLAGVNLLKQTASGRYQFHDLLRAYAADRAAHDESREQRDAAMLRMLTWYLHSADAADRVLLPHRMRVPLGGLESSVPLPPLRTYDEALSWCEAERPNLVSATRQAAELGHGSIAWRLPLALWDFFNLRKHWQDQIVTHEIGLASARDVQDVQGEAWILGSLCRSHADFRRFDQAIDCCKRALTLCRGIGDRWGEGVGLINLADTYRGMRRFDDALAHFQWGLDAFEQIDDRWGIGLALNGLGNTFRALGRYEEALVCLDRGLATFDGIGDRWGIGLALNGLGNTNRALGRLDGAQAHLQRALAVMREIGDPQGEAGILKNLGDAHCEAGRVDRAHECWGQALVIYELLEHPRMAEMRHRLDEPCK